MSKAVAREREDAMLTRAAAKIGSVNAEVRTVEVVFASEQPVKRNGRDGPYLEVLRCTADAVDTGRFEAMSVLDSHDSWSLEHRLGTVVPGSLRFANGQAIAVLKLSRKQKAQELLDDLADGHRLPISVGYSIEAIERQDGQHGGLPTVTATRWTPQEISIVPVQADPNSKTRSKEPPAMPENNTETLETRADRKLRLAERRTFVSELAQIAGRSFAKDHAEELEELVRDTRNATEAEVRERFIELLVEIDERTPTFPHVETRGMQDTQETTRKLVANAMLHRHGQVDTLMDGAHQYRGMSTVDVARDLLSQAGQDSRGSNADIIKRALHSTSDFPLILGQVGEATALRGYQLQSEQNTFQLIGTLNVVPDLREVRVLELGNGPELEKVSETGEYKRGTVKESEEGFTMAHYGKILSLSEAMLINDRLGEFLRLISQWSRVAARLEGNIAWDVIIANAKLKSDNKALFHTDHGNLAATPSALDESNLIIGRKAFRKQKDIDGQQIGLTPSFLFVGTDLEIPAQKLLQTPYNPATTADSIPAAIRSLVPVYESRIDAIATKAWFLFAKPEDTNNRGLQYSRLAGFETPRLKTHYGFDRDGVEFRLDHYFGAGLTDYRFAYKNVGV